MSFINFSYIHNGMRVGASYSSTVPNLSQRFSIRRAMLFGKTSPGNLLIIKQPGLLDMWELPGGKSLKNEKPLQTLLREVEEETSAIILERPLPVGVFIVESTIITYLFYAPISIPSVIKPDPDLDAIWDLKHVPLEEGFALLNWANILKTALLNELRPHFSS